jgi:hypothetical protein
MFSEVVDLGYPISLAMFLGLCSPAFHISLIFASATSSLESLGLWALGLLGTWALWPLGPLAIWTLGTMSVLGPFDSLGSLGGRAIMSKISRHLGHAALIISFDAASLRLSPWSIASTSSTLKASGFKVTLALVSLVTSRQRALELFDPLGLWAL